MFDKRKFDLVPDEEYLGREKDESYEAMIDELVNALGHKLEEGKYIRVKIRNKENRKIENDLIFVGVK